MRLKHIVPAAVAALALTLPAAAQQSKRGNETLKKYCTGDYLSYCGNLAPDGAVIKPAAASAHLLRHRGRALVFDSVEDLHARLDDPDLDVDADDLDEWRTAFALTAVGDADADGDSDGTDFLAWQHQLGLTAVGAAIASVPEPSTLALHGAAALLCAHRRTRSRGTHVG